MEIKGDPHEAQWTKISAENKKQYSISNHSMFKARSEACERLLLQYC